MARRLKGMGQAKYQTDGDPRTSGPGFGVTEHPDSLMTPLKWRKGRRIFVNSMSDVYRPRVRRHGG
jgi:protein gp37